MHGGRTAGIEDLPVHLVADIIRLAFDADRRLLPWLRLSLVSRCEGHDATQCTQRFDMLSSPVKRVQLQAANQGR